jgi:hypothetical protein
MVVKRIGERYVMNMNYWDGGYVLLDVTDPRPGKVTLVAESDYAQLDEERLARGHQISPEGNAHQSELSPDNRFLVGTDEDFDALRVVATITSGPYAGTEYTAINATATPPIDEDTSITGPRTFVGLACDPLPPGEGTALIERGVCGFQQKLDRIKAAGYDGGIVFNTVRPDCLALARMIAAGDIPFVFVNRTTGLKLLEVPGVSDANACSTASPSAGSPGASTTIEAIFDGWGYVRLFATHIPGDVGMPGSIRQLDTYTIPEAQNPDFAHDSGTLSVHEVAIDPNPGRKLAYFSYYAGASGWPGTGLTAWRRSAPSSTRAATTSGVSRSTRSAASSTSSPATATSVCTSSSTPAARHASARAPAPGARAPAHSRARCAAAGGRVRVCECRHREGCGR